MGKMYKDIYRVLLHDTLKLKYGWWTLSTGDKLHMSCNVSYRLFIDKYKRSNQ